MRKQMVRHTIDLDASPQVRSEQRARLDALATRPDNEIDFSDIPQLTEEFWRNAIHNPLYKPTKSLTTVRIDSDVLAWLRGQGKGYQSRINAILRREMLSAIQSKIAK